MNKITKEEEMAFIAGIFDGDGSISLIKRAPDAESRSFLYKPMLQFAKFSKELVEFINHELGGNVTFTEARMHKDKISRREIYRYKKEGGSCLKALEKFAKFLVIKKDRADFLMDYIKNNPFVRGSKKLSEDVISQREHAFQKMQLMQLNYVHKIGFSKKRAKKNTDNVYFWAYVAGLLDTDGSFCIAKHNRKDYVAYRPVISLSMNDIRGMNFIVENCTFGTFNVFKAANSRIDISHRWLISSNDEVVNLLNKIIPYLKAKKANAELLLKFCSEKKSYNKGKKVVPLEEFEFRENCHKRLMFLNKYGVSKLSLIDSEFLKQDNEAQAGSNSVQGDRLSAMAP